MLSLEDDDNLEFCDFLCWFWWMFLLIVVMFVLVMFGQYFLCVVLGDVQIWVELVLIILVVLWVGWLFFECCVQLICNCSLNMFIFIGIGVVVVFGYSLVVMLVFGLFLLLFIEYGCVGVYYEVVVVIVLLILFGQMLELWVCLKMFVVIKGLFGLVLKEVWWVNVDGIEEDILLIYVYVGDYLCVCFGEKVLVDGEVVEGCFSVDELMFMGELILVEKIVGDQVIGVIQNGIGVLVICVVKVGFDIVLLQIVQLVVQVQCFCVLMQWMVDIVVYWFVFVVLVIVVVIFFIWGFFGLELVWIFVVFNVVLVLIIVCFCVLGLVMLMLIMVVMGKVVQVGVLFCDVEVIEYMCCIDILIVDKIGIFIEGCFVFKEVVVFEGFDVDWVLYLVVSLDQGSEYLLVDVIVVEV